MPFQMLPPARVTDRPPARYAEPYQVVRFSRSINDLFSVEESSDRCTLFVESHFRPDHALRSTFTMRLFLGLDNFAVDTAWTKDLPDDSFIELKSIGGDQSNIFRVRSFSTRAVGRTNVLEV
jgi:hypothetical protein